MSEATEQAAPAPRLRFDDGVHHLMPAEDYHAAEGLSASQLKLLRYSPAHLAAALEDKPEPTRAMVWGSVFHQLILEPDAPPSWVVRPEGLDGRTKEGKAWLAQNAGKETLTADEWASVNGAAMAVLRHPAARDALMDGRPEVSLFLTEDVRGFPLLRKARLDLVTAGNAIVDFKTTPDARPPAFSRTIEDMGYHIQAAHYLDLWNALNPDDQKTTFVFFAVEKVPPFGVSAYALADRAIELGRQECRALTAVYIDCARAGHWPGYPQHIGGIDLPVWAYKEAAL